MLGPATIAAALAALVIAYILGSFPTSMVVARLVAGIDLREVGSGNPGATNVYRTMGARWAAPVATVDILKGVVAVALIAPAALDTEIFGILCGMAAIAGHSFSPFLRFKGGKGVATGIGVMLALAPLAILASIALWAVVVRATGYAGLGSIAGAAVLPVGVYVLYPTQPASLGLVVVMSGFVIVRHRSNISRLLSGTEHGLSDDPPDPGDL